MSPAFQTTDTELLQRYEKEGDEAAFRELVERYQAMVLGTAFRRSGSAELAQEVAQEVFAALARKANFLIGRPSVGGWLHQAAIYQSARALQSEVRRHARDERYSKEIPTLAPPITAGDTPEQLAMVDEALDVLSPADREALVLHYFQDLSYPEMAKLLGVNEPAVRQRVSRALDRLGRHLRDRGVKGNVVLLLLSAVAIQSTVAAPAGLASAALATAAAGGGYSAYLLLTALLSHGVTKTAAILLALAGLTAIWQQVESQPSEPHEDQIAGSVFASANQSPAYASFSEPAGSGSAPEGLAVASRSSGSVDRMLGRSSRPVTGSIAASRFQPAESSAAGGPQEKTPPGKPGPVAAAPPPSQPSAPARQKPATKPPAKSPKPVDTDDSGGSDSAENNDGSPVPLPSDPGFQFPGVLGEIAEIGGLSAVIDELRRVELLPREAAALYGELLQDVLALDPLQRTRVEAFLEDHYEQLKSEGIAGVRPPDVDLGEWKLLRETHVDEAVEGVKQVLADISPDTKAITDVLILGEKQDSDTESTSGSSVLEPVTDLVDSTVGSTIPKLTAPLKLPLLGR